VEAAAPEVRAVEFGAAAGLQAEQGMSAADRAIEPTVRPRACLVQVTYLRILVAWLVVRSKLNGRTQAWHGDGWTELVVVKVEVKVEGTEAPVLPAAVKHEPGKGGGGDSGGSDGGQKRAAEQLAEGIAGAASKRARGGVAVAAAVAQVKWEPGALDAATGAVGGSKEEVVSRPLRLGSLPTAGLGGLGVGGGGGGRLMTLGRLGAGGALGFATKWRKICEGCGLEHQEYGLASEGKKRWCSGCGEIKSEEGALQKLCEEERKNAVRERKNMCEGCGLKQPNYGLASEGKRRWCTGCGRAEGAVLIQKPKMCEGCGLKGSAYGLASERRKRWCAECAEAEEGAVSFVQAHLKMCEGCGLEQPNYGLEAEGKRRWCAGCADFWCTDLGH
jgi:hypothetical protein